MDRVALQRASSTSCLSFGTAALSSCRIILIDTCYRYSKEEHITDPRDFEKFDVLLSEKETPPTESFELWFLQEGFAGMDFTKLRVKTKPVVYIHKRKNDSKSF
eukprot:jgi/Bigna1/145356/aug1.98_g20064